MKPLEPFNAHDRAARRRRHAARRGALPVVACLSAALCCGSGALAQQGDNTDAQETPDTALTIEQSREALAQWVQVLQETAEARKDWRLKRQILKDRIDLLTQEIADVRSSIGEQEDAIAGLDDELAKLEAQNDKLKRSAQRLEQAIAGIEARTVELLARVPEPLREEVKPFAQQIPGYKKPTKTDAQPSTEPAGPTEDAESSADQEQAQADQQDAEPAPAEPPLSLRFQNVLGVLNRFNTFQGKIHESYATIELGDGSQITATTLFLGLGQGYYVGPDGSVGGMGYADEAGWVWKPIDGPTQAPKVLTAVQILKSEKPADYVTLPAEVE